MPMLQAYTLEYTQDYWLGRFRAMAGPCELLIEVADEALARECLRIAYEEALRIEHKFSRYREDNIVYKINHSGGQPVSVDDETAYLLDYAQQCFQISDGLFDITSGVLREIWHFDGSDKLPDAEAISEILPRIGWQKVSWQRPVITLGENMQIDLGGIGKEYAVDRTALLLAAQTPASILINYGGDLCATGPRSDGHGWFVGVEDPLHATSSMADKSVHNGIKEYELSKGAIATSGDARRFLFKQGVRYAHILDPTTAWPVRDAPHSVTVAAATCSEAGILSTLAMLYGREAESFLQAQNVTYWCVR